MTYYPKNATAQERVKAYHKSGKFGLAKQLAELVFDLNEALSMTHAPKEEDYET